MNASTTAIPSQVFFRSLATRRADGQLPEHLGDVIAACRAAGYDLVVVETPGIGQGDAAIVPFCDVSLYVMTPEYGAASQLEKIDMLDFADVVAVNKYERRGAEDARRDVARQLVRNREAFGVSWQDMPVFGTSAARFDDDGRHGAVPGAARPAHRAGPRRLRRRAAPRRRPRVDRPDERAATPRR
jgi:methylmalonyl-CoA mutase